MNLTHQHNIVLPLLDLAILATYIGLIACVSALIRMGIERLQEKWLDRRFEGDCDESRDGVPIRDNWGRVFHGSGDRTDSVGNGVAEKF